MRLRNPGGPRLLSEADRAGRALRPEEGRGFSQDLALLAQPPVLALERSQAGALVGLQPIVLAGVDAGLEDPVAKRLGRDAELGSDLRDRLS